MIEIHKGIREEYNELTLYYAIGDNKILLKNILIYSFDEGETFKIKRALEYFDWVCGNKEVKSHKVFKIESYEKYEEFMRGERNERN